jgi:hypothetical protein
MLLNFCYQIRNRNENVILERETLRENKIGRQKVEFLRAKEEEREKKRKK